MHIDWNNTQAVPFILNKIDSAMKINDTSSDTRW